MALKTMEQHDIIRLLAVDCMLSMTVYNTTPLGWETHNVKTSLREKLVLKYFKNLPETVKSEKAKDDELGVIKQYYYHQQHTDNEWLITHYRAVVCSSEDILRSYYRTIFVSTYNFSYEDTIHKFTAVFHYAVDPPVSSWMPTQSENVAQSSNIFFLKICFFHSSICLFLSFAHRRHVHMFKKISKHSYRHSNDS